MSGQEKPEELDIPIHPWAPSILARRDGVVTAAEVLTAAKAVSYNGDHSDALYEGTDWPDEYDAIEIVLLALETLGLKPERPTL